PPTYTPSLHDALPISNHRLNVPPDARRSAEIRVRETAVDQSAPFLGPKAPPAVFTLEKRNLHCREISFRNKTILRQDFTFRIHFSFRKLELGLILASQTRQFGGGCGGFHARKVTHCVNRPVDSLRQFFGAGRLGIGPRDVKGEYVARVKARRHPTQRLKRSEEHTSELQSRGHLVCRL